MSDERVWLTHTEHGGYFECPAGAVEAWAEMGWEPADSPPEEHNPVIAENIAAREAALEEQARLDREAAAEKRAEKKAAKEADDEPPSRSKTWSKTDTTSEGN